MLSTLRGRLVYIGLLIFIGYIGWWYAPTPPKPKPTPRSVAETWALPMPPKAQTGNNVDILNKRSPWGRLPDVVVAKPLIDPEWRVLGIITNGPERFVLIKIEGQPEQRLGINDKLPGGSKILNIADDNLCLLINGKKRNLGIYRQGPQIL